MKLSFTFTELVKIFNQWNDTELSGYEMACKLLDCWCKVQKQEYFAERNRIYPTETKG